MISTISFTSDAADIAVTVNCDAILAPGRLSRHPITFVTLSAVKVADTTTVPVCLRVITSVLTIHMGISHMTVIL
jgi:hypothetical protein